MRSFLSDNKIATPDEITAIEDEAKTEAREAKQRAWEDFLAPIREQIQQATRLCNQVVYEAGANGQAIAADNARTECY